MRRGATLSAAIAFVLVGWMQVAVAAAAPVCSGCEDALAVVYRAGRGGLPVAELWRGWSGVWAREGRLARIPLLVDGRVWEVTTQSVEVPWYDCACDRTQAALDAIDPETVCGRMFHTDWPVAVGPLPGQRVPLAKTPVDCGSEGGPWPPHFTFRAILGDLVCVHGGGSSNGCGAHTTWWASFGAVQVGANREVGLWSADEAVEVARAGEQPSLELLFPAGGEWTLEARLEAQGKMPAMNAMQAAWSEGRFRPRWLITREDCFACSDDEWESYTHSVWVDVDAPLPYALQQYGILPSAFYGLAAQVPDAIGFALLPEMSLTPELLRIAPPDKRARRRG